MTIYRLGEAREGGGVRPEGARVSRRLAEEADGIKERVAGAARNPLAGSIRASVFVKEAVGFILGHYSPDQGTAAWAAPLHEGCARGEVSPVFIYYYEL